MVSCIFKAYAFVVFRYISSEIIDSFLKEGVNVK